MTQTEARKVFISEANAIIDEIFKNEAVVHRDTVRNLVKLTTSLPERYNDVSQGSKNKIGTNAVNWAIQNTLTKVNTNI